MRFYIKTMTVWLFFPCLPHKRYGISSCPNNETILQYVLHAMAQSAVMVTTLLHYLPRGHCIQGLPKHEWNACEFEWQKDHLICRAYWFRLLTVMLHVELVSVCLRNIPSLWIRALWLPWLEWIKFLPLKILLWYFIFLGIIKSITRDHSSVITDSKAYYLGNNSSSDEVFGFFLNLLGQFFVPLSFSTLEFRDVLWMKHRVQSLLQSCMLGARCTVPHLGFLLTICKSPGHFRQ